MTDKSDEGNELVPGGVETPIPAPSETPANLAAGLNALTAELNRRLKQAEGEIKALKSGKDAAVGRIESATKPLIEQLSKYLPNVTEGQIADAQRAMVIDQIVAERLGGRPQSTSPIPGTSGEETVQIETQQLLTTYGLDPNDPAIAPVLAAWYQNPQKAEDLELKIARIALGKTKQPAPPAPPAPTGGKPAGHVDKETLADEIATLQSSRGHPRIKY